MAQCCPDDHSYRPRRRAAPFLPLSSFGAAAALLLALSVLLISDCALAHLGARRLQQGGGGSDSGSSNGACPDVPGYNYTVGVGNNEPGTTIVDLSSNGSGVDVKNATAMGLACSADCNCTAFNLQGELKSNSTPTDNNVPPDACFYARQDPIQCAPPEYLFNRRVLIVPVVSNATCLGWNGTVRVTQGSDSLGLTAGPTPKGTAGMSQCNFKPSAVNDQMFIVTPTDSGFVTFNDGASNGTRCLEVTNSSTDVGALLQLSKGACGNATHQQFQLWTRTKGGFVLLARHSGQPLMMALGSTTAVFQSQFDLNVLANNVSFTSFVFAIQPEPVCASAPGYLSNLWSTVPTKGDISSVKPYRGPADGAAACDDDCACTGFDSTGTLKSWLDPPSVVAPYGVCYYSRSALQPCCPTLSGYNLTVGQGLPASSLVIWTTNVRFDPFDRTGAPQTAASLQAAAADCSSYCLCNGFTNLGQLVTNFSDTGVVDKIAAYCTYTKQAPSTCSTANSISGRRVQLVSMLGGGCVADSGLPTTTVAPCNDTYTPSIWTVSPLGAGVNNLKDAANKLCLTELARQRDGTTLLWTTPCTSPSSQQFLVVRNPASAKGKFTVVTPDLNRCLAQVNNAPGRLVTTACAQDNRQYWDVRTEAACKSIPGYSVASFLTRTDNTYATGSFDDPDGACTADCKCQAFSVTSGGVVRLRNTTDAPDVAGSFGECYYVRLDVQDCKCPVVAGYRVAANRDRVVAGDDLATIDGASVQELAQRCSADCTCNSFNSNGVLKKGAASTAAVASSNGTICFYAKPQPTACSISCPATNLKCVTSKLAASSLPKFNVKLPRVPLPGGGNLFDLLDPPTLVKTAQSQAPALSQWFANLDCPGAGLPIFTGAAISSSGFFGPLSAGSCAQISFPTRTNSYIAGALSTSFTGFLTALGGNSTKAGQVQGAKDPGSALAICVAIDPCALDFFLGFTGISATITIPLAALPPLEIALSFKSLAYSNNGNNAGISKTAIGLWRFNQPVGFVPDPVAIVGNLYLRVGADFSWGYQVAGRRIATLKVLSDIELVTRWSDPTRFALQIQAAPSIEFLDAAFKIDFAKMAGGVRLSLLFYVEHYNDQNWNVYLGVNINVNLQQLLAGLLGPLGDVAKAILDASSALNMDVNLHLSPGGSALRLLLRGAVSLAPPMKKVVQTFNPNAPTSFAGGVGVKIQFVTINGKPKAFGSVSVDGIEYQYSTCLLNSDCMNDQVCITGLCFPKLACLSSYVRPFDDLISVGVCPSDAFQGQVRWGRCYQACRAGYSTGILGDNSRRCWENCNCGTEGLGALCSEYFPGPSWLRVCNAFTARARASYDRTLDLVCPVTARLILLTTCQYNCRAGYVPGNGSQNRPDSNQCYLAKCPASQPVQCPGGDVCVRQGTSCAEGTAQAIFGQFPTCGA